MEVSLCVIQKKERKKKDRPDNFNCNDFLYVDEALQLLKSKDNIKTFLGHLHGKYRNKEFTHQLESNDYFVDINISHENKYIMSSTHIKAYLLLASP